MHPLPAARAQMPAYARGHFQAAGLLRRGIPVRPAAKNTDAGIRLQIPTAGFRSLFRSKRLYPPPGSGRAPWQAAAVLCRQLIGHILYVGTVLPPMPLSPSSKRSAARWEAVSEASRSSPFPAASRRTLARKSGNLSAAGLLLCRSVSCAGTVRASKQAAVSCLTPAPLRRKSDYPFDAAAPGAAKAPYRRKNGRRIISGFRPRSPPPPFAERPHRAAGA